MKKRLLTFLILIILVLSLSGCATVNLRFSQLKDGTYKQTLTIVLNEQEIAASGVSNPFEEICNITELVFIDQGYTVERTGSKFVCEKTFESMDEVNENLIGTGYVANEEGQLVFIGNSATLGTVTERGVLFNTTYSTYESVFYALDTLGYMGLWSAYYAKYGVQAMFTSRHLDVSYELVTPYKSITNGDKEGTYENGYYVNTYELDRENNTITVAQRTPNRGVWYALDLALATVFALVVLLISRQHRVKLKNGGEF